MDGIPAEFYIPIKPDNEESFPFYPPTQFTLIPVITRLFNRILNDKYPSECADSALTPIPKSKGSLTDYDNYRGIAVGSVLPKIFSMILNTRGNKWAEINGKRAVGHLVSDRTGVPLTQPSSYDTPLNYISQLINLCSVLS